VPQGQNFYGIFRAFVMMRGVVALGDGVHELAVEFEAVESPVAEDFSDQRFLKLDDLAVGGAEIVGIPPGNLAAGAVAIEQGEIGMVL
jgi:hypothetical protein